MKSKAPAKLFNDERSVLQWLRTHRLECSRRQAQLRADGRRSLTTA